MVLLDAESGALRYVCEGTGGGWSSDGSRLRVTVGESYETQRNGWLEIVE